jgi:UDP-2-acetamido-3-amino-2,3-dideoxy-glucuronate N-acetyltransferase
VPDYAMVYGNPTRLQGWVCECGEKLDFAKGNTAKCPSCVKKYQKRQDKKETRVERI